MEENLILGSVVEVKVEDNCYDIMIVAKDLYIDENNKIDYAGVVYPYGYIEGQDIVYMNKDLINKVIHAPEVDKASIWYESFLKQINKEIKGEKDDKENLSYRDKSYNSEK